MRILLFWLLISFSSHAQITGKWKANDHGDQVYLVLNTDGTGRLDDEQITYTSNSNVITVKSTIENEVVQYNYSLNGNTLKISGGDLEEPLIFTRITSLPDILGAWSGNGESMEFKEDGTCIYSGHTFKYTTEAGQIKLSMPEGLVVIPYTVRNGKLIINVQGQDYTYSKGAASAQPVNSTKNVPRELAGKWCWVNVTNTNSGGASSDTCITLNEDGTYTFYSERSMSVTDQSFAGGTNSQTSDRGTWWVQGARIYYNSESRGQGSYKFEKRNHPTNQSDPMIVLDGQPFVTQYQKAPWR